MIRTDQGYKTHRATEERVLIIRITYPDGANWYLAIWKDDNTPTLYSEAEYKDKFRDY
jgi:hypothetical protein